MQSYDAKRLKSFIFQIQLPKVDCKHCKIFIVILDFFFVTAIYFITVIACSLSAFPATNTTVRNRSQHFITYAIYFLFTRFATDFYPFCCQGDCMHAKGLCLL